MAAAGRPRVARGRPVADPGGDMTDSALAIVFDPVSPPTAFEETVARLGTGIRVGLLAPGSRLPPERELAGQLGISRSTLRHAITALVQSGLLQSVRGRGGGTFVTDDPPLAGSPAVALGAEARAVLDERLATEAGATLLAAERAERSDLDALEELVARMADADDFEVYRRADIRFHIGLAEAARSPRLVAAMTEVQGRMSDLIALIPTPTRCSPTPTRSTGAWSGCWRATTAGVPCGCCASTSPGPSICSRG